MRIREAEARTHKWRCLLGRLALILLTGAIGLLEVNPAYVTGIAIVVGIAIVFTGYLLLINPFSFFNTMTQSTILLIDEVTVFTVLLLAGTGRELLVCFFLVIIIAALIDDLALTVALAAALAVAAMMYAGLEVGGVTVPVVLRVPMIVVAGLYFGYAVVPEMDEEHSQTPYHEREDDGEASA